MFDNIIGNEKIKNQLKSTIKNQKASHSYLFTGIEGIGKKLIAKEFCKTLLCLNPEENGYCNKCKSCIEFNTNNNPDAIYIEPEGNAIKINQIREMQIKVQEKPIISTHKTYIINDADKMTTEAQNCLLKTLEEPPKFVTIILIGTNENAILSTIKSRCMILHFEPIHDDEMQKYLKNNYQIEANQTMLQIFQGSIAKAIEQKDKSEIYENINTLIQNIQKSELPEFINQAEIIYQSKDEIQKILEYINTILIKKAKKENKYIKCITIVEDTKKRLKKNCNYDMSIDNMLFNMWREVN